jgi:CRP/FNR family transcriptional regulator
VLGLFASRTTDLTTLIESVAFQLLHRFERDGLIALSRKCITIRDSTGLRALTAFPAR